MDAKTYDSKTAAFAGWLIQNVPEGLTDEDMNYWMGNPDGSKEFLFGLKLPKTPPAKPTPLLSVIATINLDAVGGKKTANCFTDDVWNPNYHDGDFDRWLPANQPKADSCVITTLGFAKDWTFAEAAAKILGVGAGTSIALLSKALIENGHTMTLVQAEEMVKKAECGEKTDMRTNDHGNFFFVENKDESVSVGYVRRVVRDWFALVRSLDDSSRWHAGRRLLVRNLDASKL